MLNFRLSGLNGLWYILIVAFLLIGCSSKSFVGQAQWAQNGINDIKVDGIIQDWPQLPPLYYDEDNRMSVQMINNNEALYIYISIAGKGLKKGVLKDGLTLILEPAGMATSPFKIALREQQIMEVFYPSESDSVMMSYSEAREKGIEVENGPSGNTPMVFEAKIGFEMIYPPADIFPGTHLTVKLESTKMEIYEKFSSGESRGKPGGGGGGKRGPGGRNTGSPDGKGSAGKREQMMEPFETTLELILATTPL